MASSLRINSSDSAVQFVGNVAGVMSVVWRIIAPAKQVYRFSDRALLVMKLRATGPVEFSPNDEIVIAGRKPGWKVPREIWQTTYRAWRNADEATQYDATKNGLLRVRFDQGRLDLPETHELWIMANSSLVADSSQSFFEIEYDELPYNDPAAL